MVHYTHVQTPIGLLFAAASETGIRMIEFRGDLGRLPESEIRERIGEDCREDASRLAPLIGELEEYFRGERRAFSTPVDLQGTEFRREVWRTVAGIPYGRTLSYGEVAEKTGRPRAVRAVGGAMGANPVPLLVPCHRVIGSDGSLTGFGGGLDVKRWLLRFEASQAS